MEIAGGSPSKYTRCTALVAVPPARIAPPIVNSSGAVPSDDAGRGRLKDQPSPAPAVPGCAQGPLSPATTRQTVAGFTPDEPAMVAETASGAPAVSKYALPSGLV